MHFLNIFLSLGHTVVAVLLPYQRQGTEMWRG